MGPAIKNNDIEGIVMIGQQTEDKYLSRAT